MRLFSFLVVIVLLCSSVLGQQTTPAAPPSQVPARPSTQKPDQLPGPTAVNPAPTVAPETVRFDINLLDKKIDPCTDFYAFTCSKWMAGNPIPPDQSTWGRFTELVERNRQILRGILEKASADDPKRDAVEQKIGDYYASCMDENAINTAGIKPLQPELDRISKITSKQELTPEIISLHRIGSDALFNFGSQQDFKDANLEIAVADQGGLGLPDRDYYFKTDQKSVDIRKAYQQHVENMMELLGDPGEKAAEEAKVVMDIETALAKGSLDRTTRRDPLKIYHPMPAKELGSLAPAIDWKQYFAGIDMPPTKILNVAVPDFFKEMNGVLKNTSVDDLKTYLRWHLVHTNANVLPDKFVNENFNFYSKTLRGQKELSPRWKRCVQYTDEDLGEALGQKYVDLTFGVEGKQRTLKMVHELEESLQQDIKALPWMTEATKQQALVKLHAIANKI
ncbi:MAG TPA: M13 family metallopeptidase N-terminal domain-containing protein, partial [Terriglobales bacterium]|nr:M13 family metallopeptidase N-terminal domain-containing protein [Terriglobales bacterium]